MHFTRRRIVYRSWFRLAWSVPFGLALTVGGTRAAAGGDLAAIVFAPVGLFVIGYALWPRLVLDGRGLTVRNGSSAMVPWADVQRPRVEAQLPHLGGFMKALSRVGRASRCGQGIGPSGYPGLVLRTRSMGSCAVLAVQRHPLNQGGFPDRVAHEVEIARRAVSKHLDPVEAVRASRPGWSQRRHLGQR